MNDGARPARPDRQVDAAAVRALARYAGLPLNEDRLESHAADLAQIVAPLREWEGLRLGFRFEQRRFSYVPILAQQRPEWRRPTRLTKGRMVVEREGEVTLEPPGGGSR